jgi:hypothetical protein
MNVASACGAIVDVAFTTKVELQMSFFYKRERKRRNSFYLPVP